VLIPGERGRWSRRWRAGWEGMFLDVVPIATRFISPGISICERHLEV
jgi:hypothetical protein